MKTIVLSPLLAEMMMEDPAASAGGKGHSMIGMVIVVFIALLIALIAVSIMKGKLKTAHQKHDAANYVRDHSLNLFIREDRYLYTTEQKRRIQQTEKKEG